METNAGESHAAQVEMTLPGWRPRQRKQDPTRTPPPARLPRITRLMALAIKFQDMVDHGEVRDYADLARLGYVSLTVAQVYSPTVASGTCAGDGSAEYVNIALYDAETVGGESEAVGVAGCLFHVRGACDPIMASYASGTAYYQPGRIAGGLAGRGIAAGVPTFLGV